jgi:hypothetical protein
MTTSVPIPSVDSTPPAAPASSGPSRRALLAGALGGLGALAAAAIGRASPVRGAGDDGAVIHVGDQFLDVQTGTYLSDSATNETVLTAVSSSAGSHGFGTGVFGVSGHGYGVRGTSDTSIGVSGQSSSSTAVWGNSASSYGVFGQSSSSTGVHGLSSATNQAATVGWSGGNSTGVQGYSGSSLPAAKAKTGVFGYAAQDSASVGVRGESPAGFGIYGKTTGTGFAGYFNGKTFMSQFVEIAEMSTPAAPGGNRARLFVRDNGLGKTQLCVRFPTGTVKVLATES